MSRIGNILRERVYKKVFRKKILDDQFSKGFAEFQKTGKTSQEAYLAMINLYCLSNGKFNEELHRKLAAEQPPVKNNAVEDSLLGKLDEKDFSKINDTLNRDGYVSFEQKIPADLVKRLYDYALKAPALAAPKYD